MTLPIVIGKSSDDKPFIVDLTKLPHLFASYTEEAQVHELFALISDNLSTTNATIEVALGLSKRGTNNFFFKSDNLLVKHCFIPEEENVSTEKNREGFMIALSKEMKERKKIVKLHQVNEESCKSTLKPMIVVLHDVFHFIVSKKRSIGLIFLELLLQGPELNMHLVALSSGSYHNLLKQVVKLNPLVQERFRLGKRNKGYPMNVPLGAELVITGDDYFFFKEAGAIGYHRLYPPYEKGVIKEILTHGKVSVKPLQLIITQ